MEVFQTKWFTQYNEDIFADGTFYIEPKFSYQVTDEIKALIECYKNKEEKLICIECDDDDIVELCYDCLIHLNNIKY
ncbi:hypothetical protein U3516DRAFT_736655 [Neocallimastix sp. 'constans']